MTKEAGKGELSAFPPGFWRILTAGSESMREKAKKGRRPHSRQGYMMQLLINVGISTIITAILEIFLVSNVSAFASYLYQRGDSSPAVQRFGFVSTVSILLYVLSGIAIFSFIFLLLQQRTARDIGRIAQAVERISEGDLSVQLEIEGEGEIAHIAESINRMERDLMDLMERERSAEQSKTDLITNVAHDLRTPLTSILGYLELLRGGASLPRETEEHYIEIVYNKAVRLQKLIEELFGFTKLSYGKQNLKIGELDIVKLLSQLVEESYPNFEKHGLSYEFSSNVPSRMIQADGDLLARLFDNLITNAIKYGAEGKRILVRLRSEKNAVEVRVINYGYVIPEKELPMIFDKFYRVERSRSSSTGGTGLGLAIVKNVAEMHHGSVEVSSDLSGTCFTVRLPIRYTAEE